MLSELEAWENLEELYREIGVSGYASLVTDGKVCILTGLGTVVGVGKQLPGNSLVGTMLARLQKGTNGSSVGRYNDTHTREENLALIAQCRTECAAELAKAESIKVTA